MAKKTAAPALMMGLIVFAMSAGGQPPNQRGLYAIWYGGKSYLLDLPFITGGQVVAQWADLERQEGLYDFSAIEQKLADFGTSEAYRDFLTAFAGFLKGSAHRSSVLGVRLNFNALGTEHWVIQADKRSQEAWPQGNNRRKSGSGSFIGAARSGGI